MSLTLDEFYQIMNLLGGYMASGFNALNTAYIIDDGAFKLSLFELALGFVILEFFLAIINRVRGNEGDFARASQSTGKQPITKIGDIQASANRRHR